MQARLRAPSEGAARCGTVSTLYSSHVREIRAHISRKLSSQQDVDDLVQEVFLRTHRAALFDNLVRPRAYLYRVTGSVVADYFRRRRRQVSSAPDAEFVDEGEGTFLAGPTPEEIVIGEQTWEILCAGIARLPSKVKQAILLRKFEDLSYQDVADTMGISIRTVEKHLARALADLRQAVARKTGEQRASERG